MSNDDATKRNITCDITNANAQKQRQNKQENMKIIYGLISHDTSNDKQIKLYGLIDKSLLDDVIFVTTEDNGSSLLSSSYHLRLLIKHQHQ